MHKLLWILAGLVVLPYCAAAQDQPTMRDLMATPVKVRGVDCALFPAAALLDTLAVPDILALRRFTPTRAQVEVVEKQLRTDGVCAVRVPFSRYDAANLAYIQKNLRRYKRQYFGFYNAQQQPCFFVQLLLDINGMNWLSGRLLIEDGGASVCELYYNLTTQKFYGIGYHSQG